MLIPEFKGLSTIDSFFVIEDEGTFRNHIACYSIGFEIKVFNVRECYFDLEGNTAFRLLFLLLESHKVLEFETFICLYSTSQDSDRAGLEHEAVYHSSSCEGLERYVSGLR